MANIKSSAKRAEIDIRNRSRNRARITGMKTDLKKALAAISEKGENKVEVVKKTLKTIDLVSSKGTIHKNKAARLKSRLMKKLNTAK